MSHPSTWAPVTWAALVAADKIPITINADGITRTLLFSELVKYTLASADLTWMDTLAIGDVAAASDHALLRDATDGKVKRLLWKELQDRLLNSTDIATWMAAYTSLANVADADLFVAFSVGEGGFKRLAADEVLRYIRIATVPHTGDFTLATTDGYKRHSNRGASITITCSLPALTPPWRMRFFRHANQAYRIKPTVSEVIGSGAAGKYIEITTRGELELECFTTGEAEVVGGSATYDWEP